jgi:hypothetical protein
MSKISYNSLDKFILIILIILISGASILSDFNESLVVVLFIFIIISIYRKIRIDNIILLIILFWILINLFSILNISTAFSSNEFFGIIFRLIIAYLGIIIIGNNFWDKFENIVYTLVLISLPIYLLNLLFPDLFNSLTPIFKPITSQIFYRKENQSNYWYSFFYTNSGREEIRNAGFMWEPGAFAMMILITIISNWIKNGINLNKRILIQIVALITTLSTMGYISLSLLIVTYFIHIKKTFILTFILISLILFNFSVDSLNFIGPKITSYLEEYDSNTMYEQGYSDRLEANRILYFSLCIEKSIRYPFGYGVLKDEEYNLNAIKIVGVNGLGEILLAWGWLGFVLVLISIFKFCSSINFNLFLTFILALVILICFFSNPIERNIIFFIVVLTPYTANKLKLT